VDTTTCTHTVRVQHQLYYLALALLKANEKTLKTSLNETKVTKEIKTKFLSENSRINTQRVETV
jgi:hypothetical protein